MNFLDKPKRQITHNNYYPTQEMHFDAFDALENTVKEFINEISSRKYDFFQKIKINIKTSQKWFLAN